MHTWKHFTTSKACGLPSFNSACEPHEQLHVSNELYRLFSQLLKRENLGLPHSSLGLYSLRASQCALPKVCSAPATLINNKTKSTCNIWGPAGSGRTNFVLMRQSCREAGQCSAIEIGPKSAWLRAFFLTLGPKLLEAGGPESLPLIRARRGRFLHTPFRWGAEGWTVRRNRARNRHTP